MVADLLGNLAGWALKQKGFFALTQGKGRGKFAARPFDGGIRATNFVLKR